MSDKFIVPVLAAELWERVSENEPYKMFARVRVDSPRNIYEMAEERLQRIFEKRGGQSAILFGDRYIRFIVIPGDSIFDNLVASD